MSKCNCEICQNIDKIKWATVNECKCGCHEMDGETGHSSLCCAYPNVLRKNNPYKDLEKLEVYTEKFYKNCEQL